MYAYPVETTTTTKAVVAPLALILVQDARDYLSFGIITPLAFSRFGLDGQIRYAVFAVMSISLLWAPVCSIRLTISLFF
jgi:hypothetical protein